jgi:uncharacterized membrane protein
MTIQQTILILLVFIVSCTSSFKGCQMKGEKFAIKTEIEFNSYNKTIS